MRRVLLSIIPWILLLSIGLAEANLDNSLETVTPTETSWPLPSQRPPWPTETPYPLRTAISTPTLELPPTESPPIAYPPSSPMPNGYPGMVWLPVVAAPPPGTAYP